MKVVELYVACIAVIFIALISVAIIVVIGMGVTVWQTCGTRRARVWCGQVWGGHSS